MSILISIQHLLHRHTASYALAVAAIVMPAHARGQVTVDPATRITSSVDTLEIEKHARALSHDSLRGRGIGTRQIARAASYISRVCAELNLQPLGPAYLLPVPVMRARILESSELTVEVLGQRARYVHQRDFVHDVATRSTLREFNGEAVLVGTDDDIRASATSPNLTDKVAVTLGSVSLESAERLVEAGAVAMIHLTGTIESFNAFRLHLGRFRFFALDSAIPSSYAPPVPTLTANPQLSQLLFRSLQSGARARLQYHVETDISTLSEHNVGCVLPGSGGNGLIALTAHYDHLGVRESDIAGDSIYNGFSDNAIGVAMLLAIARAASERSSPLTADLVVLFLTAEEAGLLGSDYFVARPVVPLERFLAVINLDAGAPPAPPITWRIAGGESSALGRLAVETARSQGWSATVSPAVPNSDYFPFWRRGVPSIFLIPGAGDFEGTSADGSAALRERWDRYHRADDEWHPEFPFDGVARYAEFAYLVALAVDRAIPE